LRAAIHYITLYIYLNYPHQEARSLHQVSSQQLL